MEFRKNLSSLQQHNIECENAGKTKKSLMDYFRSRDNENKKKISVSKMTQVNIEAQAWLSGDELTNDIPTETYWKVLAEKRRVALDDALKENERLWILHDTLKKEIDQSKQLLDEANSFIEVFKEVVKDPIDDTGIDVGDISLSNGEEK